MVTHICNSSTWETEKGHQEFKGIINYTQVQDQPGLQEILSQALASPDSTNQFLDKLNYLGCLNTAAFLFLHLNKIQHTETKHLDF